MADKFYRALQDALKILVDVGDNTHAERAVMLLAGGAKPSADAHTRIHRGEMFMADKVVDSLANNGTIDIVFVTGSDDFPHVEPNAAIGGDGLLQVFEGPTFSDGTPLMPMNHKFNSDREFIGSVLYAPTVSNVGTQKLNHYIPGGTGGGAPGGSGGRGEEVILKAGTAYLFRVVNVSGQARRAGIDLMIYPAGQIPDA